MAALNLKAGQKAKLASSYSDAAKHLKITLALRDSITGGPWEGEERRQKTMMIHLEAISALFWNLEVSGKTSLFLLIVILARLTAQY